MHACHFKLVSSVLPLRAGTSRAVSLRGNRRLQSRTEVERSAYRPILSQASDVHTQPQHQPRFLDFAGINWPLTLTLSGISSVIVSGVLLFLKAQARLAAATVLLPFLAFFIGRESFKRQAEVSSNLKAAAPPYAQGPLDD